MKLYIGNKNYSSWSMRPWVLMRHFELPFDEVMLRFDSMQAGSAFKRAVAQVSPAGRVPVLQLDDGTQVWDSLAIAETLAEAHPDLALWPRDAAQRAQARSISAEMHSGFGALRSAFPTNLEARLPEIGARLLAERPEVRADVERVVGAWTAALDATPSGDGPYLFGEFGIADAMYAPVAGRFLTYGVPLPGRAAAYVECLWATPAVATWVEEALAEADFLDFEEPYRSSR